MYMLITFTRASSYKCFAFTTNNNVYKVIITLQGYIRSINDTVVFMLSAIRMLLLLLFNDYKIKMAMKPGKKRTLCTLPKNKEGCTVEGRR